MKKYLFILATAAIVASCSDTDTLKKDIQNGNGEGEPISFTSYTQKLTRAENNTNAAYSWTFFNHHETFRVWAFKNPNTTWDAPIFGQGVVGTRINATRTGESSSYTYSFNYNNANDARYWDKSAATIYQFYAAAPEDGWNFDATGVDSYANQDKAYLTTTSTLNGVNLRAATTDADKITSLTGVESSFKGTDDIDKMIAAPQSGNYQSFALASDPTKHVVDLHFIHILSKLNVTVKKDDILASKEVKLLKIEFFNLKNQGTFTEGNTVYPNGSLARWSAQSKVQVGEAPNNHDVVYSYVSADDDNDNLPDGVTLSNAANGKIYFIESLVIPQPTATEALDYDGTVTPAILYTAATAAAHNAELTGHFSENEVLDAEKLALYNAAVDPDLELDAVLTEAQANAYNATLQDAVSEGDVQTAAVMVSGTSAPYFVIQYTIDGELFTSYHNLANSFKAESTDTHFDFLEGYQNTLNINIKPETIQFSADVADWGVEQDSSTDIE